MIETDLLNLIMDHSPSLVCVKDERSVILYANRTALEVFHPSERDRVIGFTTLERLSTAEAATFLDEDRRALEQGRSEIVEEITDYTGRRRVLLVNKLGFQTSTGERRLLVIASDITELTARERALAEANKHVAEFSALAAHDLRAPLATFVSAMHLVKRDKASSLSAQATEWIDKSITSATNLASHVSSLLMASKAQRTAGALQFEKTDLNLLLAEVRFNLSAAIEGSGALFYINRLPSLWVEQHLLRQLFQNLIENSIKYRATDRVLKIFIKHECLAGRHRFTVEDNGCGMTAAVAQRAFEMFEQDETKQAGGVGLGLALCRRIVSLHAGSIRIDPTFQDGCRLLLEFPDEIGRGAPNRLAA